MYFRFRRSLELFPGLRVNLNKESASITAGARGLHLTAGKDGVAVGAGIPGTGMSLRQRLPHDLHEIASKKPKFWDMLLLHIGFTSILERAEPVWEEAAQYGIDPVSFCTWVEQRCDVISQDAERLAQYMTTDLTDALGPVGHPADADKLCSVLESVTQLTEELIGWEQETKAYSSHPLYGGIAASMSGMSKPLLDAIADIKNKLDVQVPELSKGGNVDLRFTVQAPAAADKLIEKLKEMKSERWLDWQSRVATTYKIARGSDQLGEFSSTSIRENLAAGLLFRDDWFWVEADKDWKPLADFSV